MPSEDITYCSNFSCESFKCERNPRHIRLPIPHSYMDLNGTVYCIKCGPKTGQSYEMKADFEIRSKKGMMNIFIPKGTICHIVDSVIPGHIAFKTKDGGFLAEVMPEAFENIFYTKGETERC